MGQLTRRAVPEDWPGIEMLRDASYARWKLELQERDNLHWFVSLVDGRIVTAVGYYEEGDVWVVLDWYAEETRFGKRGTSAILELLLREADEQGCGIFGMSIFPKFVEHALRRGFRFVGIALEREAKGQGCRG